MKQAILAFCLITSIMAAAQDPTVKSLQADANKTIKKEEDTTKKAWRTGGFFSLNLTQGSLSNWAAGGDKFSLSLNSILSAHAFYKKNKSSWDNTLDANFGYLRTTSLGSRKNDDRLDVVSKYGHAIAKKWNLAALFNFRTQFANGYSYSADNQKTFSSAFLSPAYVLLSLGLDFKPTDNFSLFLSPVTARWVIVKDDSLAQHGFYGVTPGEHTKSEFGAFVSATYLKDFSKTFGYKGRLDLFSNYKHNPEKVDVYFTNLFSVKISKVLAATWNIDLIYDDDVRIFGKDGHSPAWQVKSLVGAGLMVKF
jgi:Protein of unknown function (DUF3078)